MNLLDQIKRENIDLEDLRNFSFEKSSVAIMAGIKAMRERIIKSATVENKKQNILKQTHLMSQVSILDDILKLKEDLEKSLEGK